jgi:hypothetical protein
MVEFAIPLLVGTAETAGAAATSGLIGTGGALTAGGLASAVAAGAGIYQATKAAEKPEDPDVAAPGITKTVTAGIAGKLGDV